MGIPTKKTAYSAESRALDMVSMCQFSLEAVTGWEWVVKASMVNSLPSKCWNRQGLVYECFSRFL